MNIQSKRKADMISCNLTSKRWEIHRQHAQDAYVPRLYIYIAYLLEVIRKLVHFQDQELERLLGGSHRIKEKPKLLLCDGWTAMKYLKWFWDPSKDTNDSPDQLAGSEVLAGMKDVSGLLRHGAMDCGRGTTAPQGVGRKVRVLKEC